MGGWVNGWVGERLTWVGLCVLQEVTGEELVVDKTGLHVVQVAPKRSIAVLRPVR